jgi:hypothetical protein
MKTTLKIAAVTIVLALMSITDIPILPLELVLDAEAVLGVRRRTRRRTAVVAYSAGAAHSSATAAASQQQAAVTQQQAEVARQQAEVAQQQAAVAQQQAVTGQRASSVPIGTIAQALPTGCTAVTVGNAQYQDCKGTFYKAAFQGNNLVYVTVERPL